MGCPVRKVRKTGAGAELISDPDLAVAVAGGGGRGRGREAGDREAALGTEDRATDRASTSPSASSTRPGSRRSHSIRARRPSSTRARPNTPWSAELVDLIDVPVIVSGGLDSAESARVAYRESGAAAVMIARGSFGYPWIFEELTGRRTEAPDRDEIADELLWVIDAAEEHLGADRAATLPAQVLPLVPGPDGGRPPARRPASSRSRISMQARSRVRELRIRALSPPPENDLRPALAA